MIPVGKLLLSALASVAGFALWTLFGIVYQQLRTPLRHLPGPKSSNLLFGNLREIWKSEDFLLHEQWAQEYGKILKYRGLFGRYRLMTMDFRAINHVLTHSSDYQKPFEIRHILTEVVGEGVVVVEGAQHRQQRRIMNPAFGPAQIRALTDIFIAKAIQLRDVWSSEIDKDAAGISTGARIDVLHWLSRMTLDIIGLAAFNYNFDALNTSGKPDELNEAFSTMNAAASKMSVFPLLQAFVPPLRLIPSHRSYKIQAAHGTMTRIGKEFLRNAKAAAREKATEKGEIENNSQEGHDLFTLLVKANMATDVPESQKLSDKDVLAQLPTFLTAGYDTTSTGVTWALFALTQAPEVQTKLREELLTVDTETPSMDTLSALPYLDAVIRETLRVHSPIGGVVRIAMKDDVLPFDTPFTDNNGSVRDSIRICKGDPIFIPILLIHRSKELWGPDAHEFRPERWDNLPEAVTHIPGARSNLLSFLGGPRACIGYRFSIVEMKAAVFTLVRAFEFELAVPIADVYKKLSIVQRPMLRSDKTGTSQLPMFVKPYRKA